MAREAVETTTMLFAIHMIDRPGAAALRAQTADAHKTFVGAYLDSIYVGGPLLDDDGVTPIGSLVIKEFADRAEALDFITQEPYNQAGLFESVTIRAFNAVVPPT